MTHAVTFEVVPFAARGLEALNNREAGIVLLAAKLQVDCMLSQSETLIEELVTTI